MSNNPTIISRVIAGGVVFLACCFGLFRWWQSRPQVDLGLRLTDMVAETRAGTLGGGPVSTEVVDIEGTFVEFESAPMGESSPWPQFRGLNHDSISVGDVPLAEAWPEGGPPVLWGHDLGEGHAGAAIFKGRVFVMDYDEELGGDALRCFDLFDGREYWRRSYVAPTKRNHGVSRTVPAVSEKYTVAIGPRCFVMCVDTETGAYRWGIDMVKEYGTEVPLWYTGQCPVIKDGVAILAPVGAETLMMGVDCETGEVLWRTPNPGGWLMAHSSITPMKLLGINQYVYAAVGGILGVSAEPESVGELLWSSTVWTNSVTSPSPVAIEDDRIFVTAGYGGGSMMLGLKQEGDGIVISPLFELSKKVFGCEQQTPLYFKDHLYAILPKDASALRGQFVCLKTDGTINWTSGKDQRFGLGPFLVADDKILLLDDDGELTMMRASTEGYEQLARHAPLAGHDAWAPMAISDGLLVLRDSHHMICLDLRVGASNSGTKEQ